MKPFLIRFPVPATTMSAVKSGRRNDRARLNRRFVEGASSKPNEISDFDRIETKRGTILPPLCE
jgi:hypothetical protein